jgi:DNA modification methylase
VGSGTTLIACIETGHDGIGIEREAEYLEIADARVRHWNAALAAWDAARIESDHVSTSGEESEVDLNDFLGL